VQNKSQANKECDTRICFTEVRFSQTYSPLRWSQRPGLFQPFPSLKRSLGPSELLLLNQTGTNFPARTTTQLVSLALVTIELFARKSERKKQSKRKSSKEHNKSLSLITKALCGIGRRFDHFGVSCIECLALVSSWKVENLDANKCGVVGVFIAPTNTKWPLEVGCRMAHRTVRCATGHCQVRQPRQQTVGVRPLELCLVGPPGCPVCHPRVLSSSARAGAHLMRCSRPLRAK
jgi:hypothetical protein